MTLTTEQLLKNGYAQFRDPSKNYDNWYQASYQKRFRDDKGTRYFITIAHSIMPDGVGVGLQHREFFTPSNQFNKNGSTFDVDLHQNNETLEQIEQFFDDLWTKMELDYYEV